MNNWRGRCERWLNARWYGNASVPSWLGALEAVYRIGLRCRRSLYAINVLHSQKLTVPVIVIGNLTVGGTGKTPLVAWLARELRERAWHPGILSRGYRSSLRQAAIVPPGADPGIFGDEPVWLAQSSACPVAIARQRNQAAQLLIDAHCDVILSDDGLQHWALARDIEILVIDGLRRFGNGRLLPAGPLREPQSRAMRVAYRVINGGVSETGEIAMKVNATQAVRVSEIAHSVPLSEWRGQRVHAVAGIGNPERFFRMLESYSLLVIRHPWPDHHRFDGSEVRFDDDLPVLVTEKDAVKIARYAHERVYAIPIEVSMPDTWIEDIHRQLCHLREARI